MHQGDRLLRACVGDPGYTANCLPLTQFKDVLAELHVHVGGVTYMRAYGQA